MFELVLILCWLAVSSPLGMMFTSACCVSSNCARCTVKPAQIQVVIAGLTNSVCGTCSGHDGTYILNPDTLPFGECNFVTNTLNTGCYTASERVFLGFSLNGTQTRINISINAAAGAADVGWAKDLGTSPINCAALSGEDVPRTGFATNHFCSDVSSTCTVTSL